MKPRKEPMTDGERAFHEMKLRGADYAAAMLSKELIDRRAVLGMGLRDTTTHRIRREIQWAYTKREADLWMEVEAPGLLAPYFPPAGLVKRYEEKSRIRRS